MFAYCDSNPTNYSDTFGFRPVSILERFGDTSIPLPPKRAEKEKSPVNNILESMTKPKKEGNTFSVGLSTSWNNGAYGMGSTANLSADSSFNYAGQYTEDFSVSSLGMGASISVPITWTNASNVHDLEGASNSWGVTVCCGLGVSVDVVTFRPNSNPDELKWGISFAPAAGAHFEVHGGTHYTHPSTSWNPWKALNNKLFG